METKDLIIRCGLNGQGDLILSESQRTDYLYRGAGRIAALVGNGNHSSQEAADRLVAARVVDSRDTAMSCLDYIVEHLSPNAVMVKKGWFRDTLAKVFKASSIDGTPGYAIAIFKEDMGGGV